MDRFFTFYRRVALFQSLLTAALACVLLAAPRAVSSLFGLPIAPDTVLLLRVFGASLLHVATVTFLTRDTRALRTVRAISVANIVEDGILCILAFLAIRAETMAATGWILVGAFGFEVVLNAYVWLRIPRDE